MAGNDEDRPQSLCPFRYPDGSSGWRVTSHSLAKKVLLDPRFSIRSSGPHHDHRGARFDQVAELARPFRESFGLVDPPDHTRLRRILAGWFSVKRVSACRGAIERIVDECLQGMEQVGPPVDLVEIFATPVAVMSQGAFLGIPASEADWLPLFFKAFAAETSHDEAVAAGTAFQGFVAALMEQKRVHPSDDPVSDVVTQDDLTDDEKLSTLYLLLGAGHGTTADTLALSALALLTHPEQLGAAHRELPALQETVEELLRHTTVFPLAHARTALEDVEIDGTLVNAGERVAASLAAANRDPAKFDEPNVLNIARSARGHLAFGHGVHVCLGQHLARLEMQVALSGLLQRFPTLRLAVPVEEIQARTDDAAPRGVNELPVAW